MLTKCAFLFLRSFALVSSVVIVIVSSSVPDYPLCILIVAESLPTTSGALVTHCLYCRFEHQLGTQHDLRPANCLEVTRHRNNQSI